MTADKTVRTPPPAELSAEATLVRPEPPSADEGETRVHTLKAPEPPATDEGETRVHTLQSPEAPAADQGDTQVHTLKSPATRAELTGPDGTQVMRNRLVGSLQEAGEGHQGPLEPGAVIKQRFVIETVLGKGGMGVVFGAIDRRKEEARDPNPRVALKVLNAEFRQLPQSFVALQREARKAQSLAHPNVVTVFDFDRDGDAVYMTMELLEGRTLDSIVREARGKGIGSEAALPIIRDVAEGLAYAHRKGIVHSDLKPGNIFITADSAAKILDFGIARAAADSITKESQDVFDAGSFGAYTEAYATDEMVKGVDPHPADDMYALGVIAYELITGFHPYQRHSAPNARKFRVKPAPLKGLKRKQARAIERCLSFDRKRRPQNAGEFLKAFRGASRLQRATLAAAAVLALAAGYLWYDNYVETGPAIAFSELSAQRREEFRNYMEQGNAAWLFYERDGITDALPTAITSYIAAYAAHPRNRAAVAALNRAADALLDAAANDAQKREFARNLQAQSDHFRKYPPVVEAAK